MATSGKWENTRGKRWQVGAHLRYDITDWPAGPPVGSTFGDFQSVAHLRADEVSMGFSERAISNYTTRDDVYHSTLMAPTIAACGSVLSGGMPGNKSSNGCCDSRLPMYEPVCNAYLRGRAWAC